MAKVVVATVRVADDWTHDALIEACCSVRDRAFVATLFGAGCRRGEIVALTLADVDLTAARRSASRSRRMDDPALLHSRLTPSSTCGAGCSSDARWTPGLMRSG